MTRKTLALAPALVGALALGGCSGAFVGNIFVTFVAVGIFFGTLGLGRTPGGASSTASRTDRPAADGRS